MPAGTTVLRDGIVRSNPVFVMALGLCPALAVSGSVKTALAMGLATAAVLLCSSGVISLIGKMVPSRAQSITFLLVIAVFVTVIDIVYHAFIPNIYAELGIYLPLITVNCLILSRGRVFAQSNGLAMSLVDAAAMGLGFLLALVLISSVREVLGHGTFFGIAVPGISFPAIIMTAAPGAFLTLGILAALFQRIFKTNGRAG